MRDFSTRDNEIDEEKILAFLEKKGSVEMLIVISEGGARYSEIVEQTRIADSTVNRRRAEAIDLNLIERFRPEEWPDYDDDAMHYKLTPIGQAVRMVIEHFGAAETYKQYRAFRESFFETRHQVIEELQDDETSLEDLRKHTRKFENLDLFGADRHPLWD